MEREGGDHQLPVTDLVTDYAANDDPKAKAGKSRSVDISQLLAGKPEIGAPVSENAAANAEPDAGGQNRQEPCHQESLCVRGNGYITDFCVAHSFVGWFSFGLKRKRGQFYNRAPFKGRLVRAEAHAGPVGGLLRVRKRIAIFDKSADELMHQVRVRTAMPCALGETEMGFLRQIIDAFGGEPANRFGQQFRVIGRFDLPGNLRFRQFGGVQHVWLVLDERPLERLPGAIDINAFAILPGGVEQRAIDARAQIGALKLNVRGFDGEW